VPNFKPAIYQAQNEESLKAIKTIQIAAKPIINQSDSALKNRLKIENNI